MGHGVDTRSTRSRSLNSLLLLFMRPSRFRYLLYSSHHAAFTLLEIMLVVMIIALLAGSAIHLMRDNVGIAQRTRVESDIESMKTQLQIYEVSNGIGPSTEQGLKALVDRPTGDPQPRKWYRVLPAVPIDPWGMEYQYRYPAIKSTRDSYDLFSCGKDRKSDTSDDLGNW
jgi:general secretion pathway protein G